MEIKYFGEKALSYLVGKCKDTFATLTHTHTAEDVGADVAGSASASLALSEAYTDEQIGVLNESVQAELDEKVNIEDISSIPSADIQSLFSSAE